MANTISKTKSSYFHVTDLHAFRDLIAKLVTDGDEIEIDITTDANGTNVCSFNCPD